MTELEDRYSSGIYPKRPVEIVEGKGSKVWDSNGKEYIDCVGGIAVALTGHCNDTINKAIKEQLDRIVVNPGIFYSDIRGKLFEKLAEITPEELSRSFLSNSGTESVECTIKISRKFTGRTEFIAMKKCFHGRTMGSLSATWPVKYKKSFEPLVPGFTHGKLNDIESVKELVTKNTAAIIVEPVQGEGGVNPTTKEFMRGLRDISNDNESLLIFDEIQCGLGRTGKLFAFEHSGVIPDILCLGKGIASGLPIGVTIARPEIFESLKGGEHGSTLGGNPLCCASALATLDYIIDNKLPERSERFGKYMLNELRKIESEIVKEVRGLGLMVGIDTRLAAKDYVLKAIDKGILIHISGLTTLRLLPPLVIEKEEIDQVVKVLGEIL
ncbi:MAG: aspartate aminotransferase family protein [Candidatus Aenigmarchaeota archaeon]|nr:aspartate aminotransferase family protein [Candidatus Aenigmarchaeota archaeon]